MLCGTMFLLISLYPPYLGQPWKKHGRLLVLYKGYLLNRVSAIQGICYTGFPLQGAFTVYIFFLLFHSKQIYFHIIQRCLSCAEKLLLKSSNDNSSLNDFLVDCLSSLEGMISFCLASILWGIRFILDIYTVDGPSILQGLVITFHEAISSFAVKNDHL